MYNMMLIWLPYTVSNDDGNGLVWGQYFLVECRNMDNLDQFVSRNNLFFNSCVRSVNSTCRELIVALCNGFRASIYSHLANVQ